MTHERSFRFSRDSAALSILDTARGSGTHRMHWHFHIAPEVRVDRLEASAFRLAVDGACFRLESLDALEGRVADAWYSPSYGVRVPCRAIDFKEDVSLNGERRWRFRIGAE
jgi:hypothetical protein